MMPNPLQSDMTPAPAPAQPNAIQQGGGVQPMQQAPQGAQQAPPAPTHAQTVAALRHFTALKQELTVLLKNPDLGKADMKSAIIDGVTKLVADRIVPPAAAVQKLAMVPDTPFQQKKWIEQDYAQVTQAENSVLDHHRAQAIGTGNFQLENELHQSNPDNHLQDIQGMMASHYSGQQNA